jgi:hypothetical protein
VVAVVKDILGHDDLQSVGGTHSGSFRCVDIRLPILAPVEYPINCCSKNGWIIIDRS